MTRDRTVCAMPTRATRPPDTFDPAGLPDRAAHRLYAHIIWATRGREILGTPAVRGAVESRLISLCRRLDVEPLAVAALADRAHVLIRFKPTQSLGAIVARLKEGFATAPATARSPVSWARGYAAITVGSRDVRRVMRHLARLGEACDASEPFGRAGRRKRRSRRHRPLTPDARGR